MARSVPFCWYRHLFQFLGPILVLSCLCKTKNWDSIYENQSKLDMLIITLELDTQHSKDYTVHTGKIVHNLCNGMVVQGGMHMCICV